MVTSDDTSSYRDQSGGSNPPRCPIVYLIFSIRLKFCLNPLLGRMMVHFDSFRFFIKDLCAEASSSMVERRLTSDAGSSPVLSPMFFLLFINIFFYVS